MTLTLQKLNNCFLSHLENPYSLHSSQGHKWSGPSPFLQFLIPFPCSLFSSYSGHSLVFVNAFRSFWSHGLCRSHFTCLKPHKHIPMLIHSALFGSLGFSKSICWINKRVDSSNLIWELPCDKEQNHSRKIEIFLQILVESEFQLSDSLIWLPLINYLIWNRLLSLGHNLIHESKTFSCLSKASQQLPPGPRPPRLLVSQYSDTSESLHTIMLCYTLSTTCCVLLKAPVHTVHKSSQDSPSDHCFFLLA